MEGLDLSSHKTHVLLEFDDMQNMLHSNALSDWPHVLLETIL